MPKSYKTIAGDTWDLIAYKALGNEYYTDLLMKANLQYKETFIFSAGVILTLPEIETPLPDSLPPWKRGK